MLPPPLLCRPPPSVPPTRLQAFVPVHPVTKNGKRALSTANGTAPAPPPPAADDSFVRFPRGLLAPASCVAAASAVTPAPGPAAKAGKKGGGGASAASGTAASAVAEPLPESPPELDLYGVLGCASGPSDPCVNGDAFKLGLLRCALLALRRAGGLAEGSVAYEQLFAPALAALGALKRGLPRLPSELERLRCVLVVVVVGAMTPRSRINIHPS